MTTAAPPCNSSCGYAGGVSCELDANHDGMHRHGVEAAREVVYWDGADRATVATRASLVTELLAWTTLLAAPAIEVEAGQLRLAQAAREAALARIATIATTLLGVRSLRFERTVESADEDTEMDDIPRPNWRVSNDPDTKQVDKLTEALRKATGWPATTTTVPARPKRKSRRR